MSAHYEAFGKYILLEKLATGGMAEVFLARGNGAGGIGKFFAIKRILPQYADSPEFIDMFKDEAKIAINLSHSNIVSIHEFGVEKGQFFLVMDYVEGRNLRQILNKMKKSGLQFSIDQIVYVIKEVAAGLDHAHRCIDGSTGRPLNITHRDMSPQNLMVSFEGEVKIVDFGIAKAESQLETTRAGTLKGKFGYMSPEQAEGQPVDLRTDIFSLGIVLWELLAHDRLFVANNEINTLRKIRDCQIPSLRKINPNIHTELERISQKALARDRNLRYQTGAALHRDLNRFLNRQYPDFSAQDFAVFIKSVFADEILSLRKRLVDYAKINFNGQSQAYPESKSFDDRTSLLDTNTSSLVVSDSEVSDKDPNATHSHVSVPSEPTMVSASVPTIPESTVADATSVSFSMAPSEDAPESSSAVTAPDMIETNQLIEPPQAPQPIEAKSEGDSHQDMPTAIARPTGLLDDAALASSMKGTRVTQKSRSRVQPLDSLPQDSNPSIPGGFESDEDMMQPSLTGITNPGRPSARAAQTMAQKQERYGGHAQTKAKNGGARFATFIVFTMMSTLVFIYLCKVYPQMMEPTVRSLSLYVPGIETLLPSRVPASPLPEPAPRAQNTQRPFLEVSPNAVVVLSTPSGAEIWINGQSTGLTTPQTVQVPQAEPFTISLRKRGWLEVKRDGLTRDLLRGKFEADLEKLNIGYLNIEIFPPIEAVLYVNGQRVPVTKAQARDVPVPAGRSIKVRAESAGYYDEISVTVGQDGRRAVRINPRKNARVPSGE